MLIACALKSTLMAQQDSLPGQEMLTTVFHEVKISHSNEKSLIMQDESLYYFPQLEVAEKFLTSHAK